jgi:hypothetical protein
MKPNSTISLGSSDLHLTIENLRGKDTVKLKTLMTDTNSSEKVVILKPGGSFSRVLGFLSSKSQREKNATDACNKIKKVFSNVADEKLIDSLMKNIREQITKTGCLTGDFLSRNLEALGNQQTLVRQDETIS